MAVLSDSRGLLVAPVLLFTACGESSTDGVKMMNVGDAGTGGTAGGGGIAVTGGIAGIGGTGGTAGTAGTAGSPPVVQSDAAMGSGSDAAFAEAGPVADVIVYEGPPPPADCIVPCLWDLLKECLPTSDCYIEGASSDAGAFEAGTVRCEPTTGWYSQTTSAGQAGTSLSVYKNGNLCYVARWGGASPIDGRLYVAPSGQIVAVVSYDWTWAICGPNPGQSMAQTMYPTRPDCAPFMSLVIPSTDCALAPDPTTCEP